VVDGGALLTDCTCTNSLAYHVDDMSDETTPPHHHTLRERINAAEAAADEVVADESGQLAGEVNALVLPFEEAAAAVRAALHPDRAAEEDDHGAPTAPTDAAAEEQHPPADESGN
jgi:hypothetical protein